jgi:hypothetical protein
MATSEFFESLQQRLMFMVIHYHRLGSIFIGTASGVISWAFGSKKLGKLIPQLRSSHVEHDPFTSFATASLQPVVEAHTHGVVPIVLSAKF